MPKKAKQPQKADASLGLAVVNARERTRRRRRKDSAGGDDTPSTPPPPPQQSCTDESSLEEFLARAQLADQQFAADRDNARFVSVEEKTSVVSRRQPRALDAADAAKLRIPRRPPASMWSDAEQLADVEVRQFLEWRRQLAELSEVEGVLLTPYERNIELWRQLWRVVERSDVVVQVLDARNPLLFRSEDLEAYVSESGPAKRNVLLINKADLLTPRQRQRWRDYFDAADVSTFFWSAVVDDELRLAESESLVEPDVSSDSDSDADNESDRDEEDAEVEDVTDELEAESPFADLVRADDLLDALRAWKRADAERIVVGFVGYPNVGKSSTLNRLLGCKKVAVSATPGKTRHFQTLVVDDALTLCDCPGLVMPSLALSRDEMLLGGVLPVDQMRQFRSPVDALLSRLPRRAIERAYGVMLPKAAVEDAPPSAENALASIAFMRGFMSAGGVPDRSRAARLLLKDVVTGKLRWAAAPPGDDQADFDDFGADDVAGSKGAVVLEQLTKRRLLDARSTAADELDSRFFGAPPSAAHTKKRASNRDASTKRHFNKNSKQKLRRMYGHLDA